VSELSPREADAVIAALHATIAQLEQLVGEHHAVGALDDARIGDDCPVCKRWREQHEG